MLEKPTATRRQLAPILVESQLDVVVLWPPGAKVGVAGVPANACLSLSSNSREPGWDVTHGWMIGSELKRRTSQEDHLSQHPIDASGSM